MINNGLAKYLRLVKFSHTVFAMPFAILGFFLAIHINPLDYDWRLLGLVILCMVFARNAAMSFNRLVDRFIDAKNPRTSPRMLPSGQIEPSKVLIFTIANALLFIVTTYFINHLVFLLSPIALIVTLGYSYTKRFTSLCHFVLGLGLSFAPIGAYLAVTGEWHPLPLLFSAIVLLWVTGFDILYSLQDEVFDRAEMLKSIPAQLGRNRAIALSVLLHLIVVGLVIITGSTINRAFEGAIFLYWLGSALFIILLFSQHASLKYPKLVGSLLPFSLVNGLSSVAYCTLSILSFYFPHI